MQYKKFTQQVREGAIAPCFALIGEERFLRQQGLTLLRDSLLDRQTGELNSDTFRADEIDNLLLVVQRALTYPMLAERRLIILRNAEALQRLDRSPLEDYLKNPNEQTCLVLEGEALDKRTTLGRHTMKGRVECKPWRSRDTHDWLRDEAAQRGCAIEDEAIRLLIELIGNNLMLLHNELEKLSLLVGGSGAITIQQVEELIAERRDTSLYDLADAIGERTQKTALSHLNALLTEGAKPALLLSILKQRFRKMQKARALQEAGKGGHGSAFASALGVPGFVAQKLAVQHQRYSQEGLDRAFRVLEDVERSLKSTQIPPQILLERAVRNLCE